MFRALALSLTTLTLAAAAFAGGSGHVTKVVVVTGHKAPGAIYKYQGACPHKIDFIATVTVDGPVSLRYRWDRSDGSSGPEMTHEFKGAGAVGLPVDSWTLGAAGEHKVGWVKLHIVSPVNSTETGQFVLDCAK